MNGCKTIKKNNYKPSLQRTIRDINFGQRALFFHRKLKSSPLSEKIKIKIRMIHKETNFKKIKPESFYNS